MSGQASGRIAELIARRVWDSRGRPTIEVEITTEGGKTGRSIAPSGASTGSNEAIEKRDGGHALNGLDVLHAINGVNDEIAAALRGLDCADQATIDHVLIELDGTPNKARLGANATIATSMAAAQTAALCKNQPLWQHCRSMLDSALSITTIPLPEIQIFGGGAHAGSRIDIQDLMVICPAATSFDQALLWTAEIYMAAGAIMKKRGSLNGVADEGGYWPAFNSNEEALETLTEAISLAGFNPGDEVAIALDIAASEFYQNGRYTLALDNASLTTSQMIDLLKQWVQSYPIRSIEDPLSEHDPDGFLALTRELGDSIQIVGDDLLVSDAERTRSAAKLGLCNTVLLKPNQRGTLSELLECWQTARNFGMSGIISARSGETEDVTITHLAVGWNVPQLKVGSFSRSERMAKWNEAIRIEQSLGPNTSFAGFDAIRPGPRMAPNITA